MAIAKNPKRNLSVISTEEGDRQAEAFISGAGQAVSAPSPATQSVAQPPVVPETTPEEEAENGKKQVIVRVEPELIKRMDKAAKRLGISRAAFIVSSAAEKLERME